MYVQYLDKKIAAEKKQQIAHTSPYLELRVPQQRREHLEQLTVGSFVEIGGRVQGIARRASESVVHLNNELVAERIQKAVLLDDSTGNPFSGIEKGFQITGVVLGCELPRSEKAFAKIHVQYGPPRESQFRAHEFTNTVAVKIPPNLFDAALMVHGQGLCIQGYPQAAVFRVPGTTHEITESELVAVRVKPTLIVNASLSGFVKVLA